MTITEREQFWERILKLLEKRKLKKADLARILNKKTGWLSTVEIRKSIPATETVYQIATFLETSVEFLITGKDVLSSDFSDEQELLDAFRAIQRSRINSKIACQLPLLSLEQQQAVSVMIDAMGVEKPQ